MPKPIACFAFIENDFDLAVRKPCNGTEDARGKSAASTDVEALSESRAADEIGCLRAFLEHGITDQYVPLLIGDAVKRAAPYHGCVRRRVRTEFNDDEIHGMRPSWEAEIKIKSGSCQT